MDYRRTEIGDILGLVGLVLFIGGLLAAVILVTSPEPERGPECRYQFDSQSRYTEVCLHRQARPATLPAQNSPKENIATKEGTRRK